MSISRAIAELARGIDSGTNTTTFGTVDTTTIELAGWTITESAGTLYFATGGSNKMILDSSGNISVIGNVTGFETL